MTSTPAYRHDPRKVVLDLRPATGRLHWDREPAVCGYQRFGHHSVTADREIAVPVCACPAVITGAGVVVACFDGRVRFFDRSLEKVSWERRLGSPVYSSIVVDQARRTVLVAAIGGRVACYDLRGRPVWCTDTGVRFYATPTVLPESDILVLAGFGSRCLGLELATGKRVFERELPQPWHAATGGSAAHRDPYPSPAATADGNVIVCCAEHVLCLAPDGTELWRREIGHAVRASPAALHAVDEVAVCSVDGLCRFLDTGNGNSRGAVDIDAKIVASPAVSGDMLIVGACDDSVVGIDIRRHEVAWNGTGAPRDHTSFSVLPNGDFVATTTRGNAVGRRRSDGRFLWETSQLLGLPEHDPAMDTTPMVGADGSMYGASYTGVIYHFRFRPMSDE